MRAYKFLARGAVGRFSDFQWPPPGEWVETGRQVVDCLHGVHALHAEQLLEWIDDELWEIELGGTVVAREGMLIAERGRLGRRIDGWNDAAAQAFADACARRSGVIAARALRQAGLIDDAERMEQAANLAAIQEAAVASLDATANAAVTDALSFAADLASLVGGDRPETWIHTGAAIRVAQSPASTAANAAYVAAHAAGHAAAAEAADEGSYGVAFQEERAWQLARLNQLLEKPALS